MKSNKKNECWEYSAQTQNFSFSHKPTGCFFKGSAGIQIDQTMRNPVSISTENSCLIFRFEGEMKLSFHFDQNSDQITIFPVLVNSGDSAVVVGDIILLDCQAVWPPSFSRAFVNGRTMVDNTGLFSLNEGVVSNSVIGLTDNVGQTALVIGALRPDDAWYDFFIETSQTDCSRLKIICGLGNTILPRGAVRQLSPICFCAGESMSFLLRRYAKDVAEQLNQTFRFSNPPSGWCSWYHYYGSDDINDIRNNMKAISASPLKDRLQVIQIDDGWNLPRRDAERCWGDWQPGGKYPDGMKALADEIHANGFFAGLWLAPFSVDMGSHLYRKHPEWLVQRSGSEKQLDPLASPSGIFGLDLTRPDVQDFIHETFRRVFHDWGFDYIKIDFLSHGAFEGTRWDQSKTGIEAFRIGMKIIREEAGPHRFILNCGSPIVASVGLCDGMRIGMDVGGRWFAPMNLANWKYGNCCIKAAENSTIWRQWMHGIWWYNDPDCIILRNQGTCVEWNMFKDHPMENPPARKDDFSLTSEETLGWLRLIWLTGGMFIISEDMTELTDGHWRILDRSFPPNFNPVYRMDRDFGPDISVFKAVAGEPTVGLFNLSDVPVRIFCPAEDLGLGATWEFKEIFNEYRFFGSGSIVVFPELPARSGSVWKVDPVAMRL